MRRAVVRVVALTAFALASYAGCTFPDPAILSEEPGDGGPDGSNGDAAEGGDQTDGAVDGKSDALGDSSTDAPADGEILIDGESPDALIVHDAGGKIDATAGCGCDCDKDTFNDTLKGGCNTGQNDCDDTDTRAHPGQGFLEDTPVAPTFGDWNCDGTPEPLYKVSVTCAGLTLGINCPSIFGFKDAPSCGQTGNFIRCMPGSGLGFLNCVEDPSQAKTLVQPCR